MTHITNSTSASKPSHKLTVPVLLNYEIVREIEQNGYGILYEARDLEKEVSQPLLLQVLAPEITSSENFIVRFELLKSVLPQVRHQNLLSIITVATDRNIHFVVKEMPVTKSGKLTTLADYGLRHAPNQQQAMAAIFQGLSDALFALETFRNSYYSEGIILDNLSPERIYLDFRATQESGVPSPKIDGFCESFLYYDDGPDSLNRYTVASPLSQFARKGRLTQLPQSMGLFKEQYLYPHSGRHGKKVSSSFMQYSFGALIYQTLTGHLPKGIFPSLQQLDPTLDSFWSELVDTCLGAPYEKGYESMQVISQALTSHRKQQAALSPLEIKLRSLVPPPGMALVATPEKILLGNSSGPSNEQPSFKARIKPFFIDIHPVTCKQFNRFMTSYKSSTYSRGEERPATLVTWQMAKAYCKWRSEWEQLPSDSYRLPTEYEWETAVRGHTGEQYPWGKEPQEQLVHAGCDQDVGTIQVKKGIPGRYGLHDMLGNIWEWTESVYKPHPFSKHREKGYDGRHRVVKGGCWFTPLSECRASLRSGYTINDSRGNVGFRCVLPIEMEESSLDTSKEPTPQ